MQTEHFNSIEIGTRTDGENPNGYGGFGIQIIIDGTIYTEGDDYYVDIDSFFEALSQHKAVIQFVGGCHWPDCCANQLCESPLLVTGMRHEASFKPICSHRIISTFVFRAPAKRQM